MKYSLRTELQIMWWFCKKKPCSCDPDPLRAVEDQLAQSFLSVCLSSMSSGVTAHSCEMNVLSRQSFVLHQPTVTSQRYISQAGRLQDRVCAGEPAEELLVLRPQESCWVLTVSTRQMSALLLHSGI